MTRERNNYPLLSAVAALFICLLVCIGLIASGSITKNNFNDQLSVYEQNYRMDISRLDRTYELKLGRLEEQMNSNEFVSRKRIQLLEDDISRNKMDIQLLNEKLKARHQ